MAQSVHSAISLKTANRRKIHGLSVQGQAGYAVKPLKGNALIFFNVQPNIAPDENISNARCLVLQDSDKCNDEEDSCPKWAAQGECNRNPMGSQADSGHQQQHNSQFLPLSRQTSFYSLTLDEV
ncbi:hypothetical protein IFM89_017804 [Coptis chinensis]|uniref:Uncharacterized protein n=1 Tax=Coptis chinensis TaxID=261450 RepID=A0A835LIE9_9MAGN|nr:hypothetical protein IFM89_017804 [Coptis chinensis]